MHFGKQLKEGLLTRNPLAMRLLGLCTALAVTTNLLGGLGMGLCVLVVLTASNVILSVLAPYIPREIYRISAIVITATLGGIGDLAVQALFPVLAGELGFFLPLVAVTCVLLNGAGDYAYENGVAAAGAEGLCQGLGYALVLVLVSVLRELLGKGSFGEGLLNGGRGIRLFGVRYAAGGLSLPVGGFLVLACVVALLQALNGRPKRKKKKEEASKG